MPIRVTVQPAAVSFRAMQVAFRMRTCTVVVEAAAGAAVVAVMDVAEVLLEAAGASEGVGAPHP